jgi:NAD(P)H-dependent FMN reductase
MACRFLLVSGSLRAGSTNSAVLRTVRGLLPLGMEGVAYDGLGTLPHFNPDNDGTSVPVQVADLRAAIHSATAVLFCTPEYAGGLPGSFKNLLDWTIGDDQPGSIYEKPVAWINASPRGAWAAHEELRRVLGYAHASIVEEACCDVPVSSSAIGGDGVINDPDAGDRIRRSLMALAGATGCAI